MVFAFILIKNVFCNFIIIFSWSILVVLMLHKESKRKSWLYGLNVIPSLQQAISLFVFRLEILISLQKLKKQCRSLNMYQCKLLVNHLRIRSYGLNKSKLILHHKCIFDICHRSPLMDWFGCMVLNATFNNISVISWMSVLLVEETGIPIENHWPVASYWQTLSHNVVSSTRRLSGIRIHNVSGDRH
jgi:hypothetical protein